MTAELYENFLDIEMKDEVFSQFEKVSGRKKPRFLKNNDLPIIKNRLRFLKTNKPIKIWPYCSAISIIILLILGFDATWWGWLSALIFFTWGISAVGAAQVAFFKHGHAIAELEREIRWKQSVRHGNKDNLSI